MNGVVILAVFIAAFLLLEPVQAGSNYLGNSVLPSLKQNSFEIPVLGEVFASGSGEIESVDGSDIRGNIRLVEIPRNLDTQIAVEISGLEPDGQYVAIYHQNFNCEKEVGSIEKSVKGAFFADSAGRGVVQDKVKDSVNRIGSVSIRRAEDFGVVACGRV